MQKATLLWQFYRPDHPAQVGLIFGTMHLQDQLAFHAFDTAKALLSTCRLLATEIPIDQTQASAWTTFMQTPPAQPITDFYSPKAIERIKKSIQRYTGIDATPFLDKHPFFLLTLLAQQAFEAHQPVALDAALWEAAKTQGLSLTGLETLEDQIGTLEEIPLRYFYKQLKDAATQVGKHNKKLQKQARWYQEQDIEKIYRAAKKDLKSMRKPMLTDRNKRMAQRIVALYAEEPRCFIAVGAAHLAGGKGILRLLKKAGFAVKPLLVR